MAMDGLVEYIEEEDEVSLSVSLPAVVKAVFFAFIGFEEVGSSRAGSMGAPRRELMSANSHSSEQ